MKGIELKVARIGNSRGVRLPASTIARYRIGESVVMEELAEGILLRPRRSATPKLSWEDTAREMASGTEDWTAWEQTSSDGLDDLPWEQTPRRRIAEKVPSYAAKKPKAKRAPKK